MERNSTETLDDRLDSLLITQIDPNSIFIHSPSLELKKRPSGRNAYLHPARRAHHDALGAREGDRSRA
mgnify:CR=1 FL=1